MFSKFRYCKTGLIAVLMQAASVFNELDELSFVLVLAAAAMFMFFCVVMEYRRWSQRQKHVEPTRRV